MQAFILAGCPEHARQPLERAGCLTTLLERHMADIQYLQSHLHPLECHPVPCAAGSSSAGRALAAAQHRLLRTGRSYNNLSIRMRYHSGKSTS